MKTSPFSIRDTCIFHIPAVCRHCSFLAIIELLKLSLTVTAKECLKKEVSANVVKYWYPVTT